MTQPGDCYQPSKRLLDAIEKCVSEGRKFEDKMNAFIEQAKMDGFPDTDIVKFVMAIVGEEGCEYAIEIQEQLKTMEEIRVKTGEYRNA